MKRRWRRWLQLKGVMANRRHSSAHARTHPKRQKRGILVPTIPLTTGPLWMPMRMPMGSPVTGFFTFFEADKTACKQGHKFLS